MVTKCFSYWKQESLDKDLIIEDRQAKIKVFEEIEENIIKDTKWANVTEFKEFLLQNIVILEKLND